MNEQDHGDDEPLGPRLGQAWPTDEATPGFAERVVAARRRLAAARPRRSRIIAFALATSLLAPATGWTLWQSLGVVDGQASPRARTSIAIGRRGTAVLEAGAALSYRVQFGGATAVEQSRGEVFYRVEPGGAFDVAAPGAQIHVTGTCFRVEVVALNVKQSVVGAALGASVASAVVVTVYEGRVDVRSARGAVPLAAGESLSTAGRHPPSFVVDEPGSSGAPSPSPAAPEIARLQKRIAELESHPHNGVKVFEGTEAVTVAGAGDQEKLAEKVAPRKFLDFTREDWAEMAKSCEMRAQLPPLSLGGEPGLLEEPEAAHLGFSPEDRAKYNQLLRAASDEHRAALAAIYRDITGEPGDHLIPMSLDSEIRAKSPPAEFSAARRRYAEEKAGMTRAQDPATFSPMDRFVRLQSSAWESFESKLTALIGADKARAARTRPAVVRLRASGCQ